jgi:outer membrane protein assembly factor BamB
MASPLLVGDELYFVSDSGGMLTCLDAKTGNENYRERLGGEHNASLLHADGRIYISSRTGTTAVIEPSKVFKLIAKNELPGQAMASIAIADRAMFLRTDAALYRIEEKIPAADP